MSGQGGGTAGCAIGAVTAMFGLILSLVLLLAVGGPGITPAAGQPLKPASVPAQYTEWINKAGGLCPQITAPLIAAQLKTENESWNPKAVSNKGAQGLAQFIPSTWKDYGQDDDGNGTASPYDPGDAIMGMGRYDCALAAQVAKVPGDPLSNTLAAYNAGPGAVLRSQGIPPFPETQAYVKKILNRLPAFTGTSAPQAGSPDFGPGTAFGQRVVAAAKRWIGAPYLWGGGDENGPTSGCGHYGSCVRNGFDCSGLVQYAVYQASGKKLILPRTAKTQSLSPKGQLIPRDFTQLRPGDIIAFGNHDWGHIGIYLGGDKMIHAPSTFDFVKVSSVRVSYYASQQWRIRRFG